MSLLRAANLLVEWFHPNLPAQDDEPVGKPTPAKSKPALVSKPAIKDSEADSGENPPLDFELKHLQPEHPYLSERGLTAETIQTFGLGFCAKGLLTGRIAIPIHNPDGQLVAYAGRWPGLPPEGKEKYKLPRGFKKSLEIFNLHRALAQPAEQPLVVVEGFFDCLNLWQHGIKRVLALMGSSLSAAQEALLRQHLTPQSRVLVMLDEDDAGRRGRDDIAARLAPFAFVHVHRFEEEGAQPDQLKAEEVAQLLARAP